MFIKVLRYGLIMAALSIATFSGGTALPVQANDAAIPPPQVSAAALTPGSLSAGFDHTCLLTTTGGVYCWGFNGFGQLGSGSSVSYQPFPQPVPGLTSGVKQIAAGAYHTCALMDSGAVQCWGYNLQGQVGAPKPASGNSYFSPVVVAGISGATALSAGYDFTCAVTGGGVKCWGNNRWGALGLDPATVTNSNSPLDVTNLASGSGATAVAAGYDHACALVGTAVWCWGTNASGQLGNGSQVSSFTPVNTGLSGVSAVVTGSQHSCAIASGGVKCWGENLYGQVGNGSTTAIITSPTNVSGLTSGVTAIAAGGDADNGHTCAVQGGAVKCWGANTSGQLGNGGFDNQNAPVQALSSGAASLALGVSHSCAIVGSSVQCWGSDAFGQLGDGVVSSSLAPIDAFSLADVSSLGMGERSTCAVVGGAAYCWGDNRYGQVGDGTKVNRPLPVSVPGLESGVVAVDGGESFSCALVNGGIQCWGMWANANHTPTTILPGGVSAFSVSFQHACAVTGGAAMCWGDNTTGALGDGSTTSGFTPVQVSGLTSGVSAITTGGYSQGGTHYGHSCAVVNGGVWCWGNNNAGQLGNGNTNQQLTPVQVSGLTGVTAVAAGQDHTCALLSDQTVKCWGNNTQGQLGDGSNLATGTNPQSLIPIPVVGLSGVKAITAGGYHTCALTNSGAAYCWGYNSSGQLGNNSVLHSSKPVAVSGLGTGVQAIYAGGINYDEEHTCAVLAGGSVRCWGGNEYGQLGDNLPILRSRPVQVVGLSGQPELGLNYTDGQAGSYFRLVGANFPVSTPLTVIINGKPIGLLTTSAQGYLIGHLRSHLQASGAYTLTVSGMSGPGLTLNIDAASTLHLREGSGSIFGLDSPLIYLPVIKVP